MAFSVVIDPGHGGSDGGAVGNGIVEKDLTLDISEVMYNEFKNAGIPVYITRTDDETLMPDERVRRAKNAFGTSSDVVLISNHINAGGGSGAEVIYALRNNDKLASKILSNLAREGQDIRSYYQRRSSSNPSKDYYFILRDTPNIESVIVEYGFLDNLNDSNDLKNNYKRYAKAVVNAVLDYKGINSNNTGNVYIVKSGDTLYSIAKMYGVTVDSLKNANNLNSSLLSIGQVLNIPSNTSLNTYIVKKGDTLYSIAKTFNTSVNALKTLNKLNTDLISIGQVLYIK